VKLVVRPPRAPGTGTRARGADLPALGPLLVRRIVEQRAHRRERVVQQPAGRAVGAQQARDLVQQLGVARTLALEEGGALVLGQLDRAVEQGPGPFPVVRAAFCPLGLSDASSRRSSSR
jgi:hypothetical protein